jgi:8-oxo-dGTP diphosphatase
VPGWTWRSAAASIYDPAADAFLLIQRMDDRTWQPPGGLLEAGERLEWATIREVKEETGVQISIGRLSGIYQDPALGVVSLVFACRYLSGSLTASPESRSVAWIKRSEIARRVVPAYACRVLDALNDNIQIRMTDDVAILD